MEMESECMDTINRHCAVNRGGWLRDNHDAR
jgi:hypothetical protein